MSAIQQVIASLGGGFAGAAYWIGGFVQQSTAYPLYDIAKQSDGALRVSGTLSTSGIGGSLAALTDRGVVSWVLADLDGGGVPSRSALDSADNLIVARADESSSQLHIKRFNSAGSNTATAWNKTFTQYMLGKVAVSVAGTTPYVACVDSASGAVGVVLIKYNSSLVEQWQRKLPIAVGAITDLSEMVADASGNVYVFCKYRPGSYDQVAILKFDSTGALVAQTAVSSGSSHCLLYGKPSIDSSGNFFMCVTGAGNNWNILRLDAAFAVTLHKVLSISGDTTAFGRAIDVDSAGNIYVAGQKSGGNGYIAKLDSAGGYLWARKLICAAGTDSTEIHDVLAYDTTKFALCGKSQTTSGPTYRTLTAMLPADGSLTGTYDIYTYSAITASVSTGTGISTGAISITASTPSYSNASPTTPYSAAGATYQAAALP